MNKSKTLTKHTTCKCKRRFDCRKSNSNKKWKNDKFCEAGKVSCVQKKIILGILLHVLVQTVNILKVLLSIQ